MRVAFLTRDPDTVASARVRIGQYLPLLEREGVESRVRTWDVVDRRSSLRYARDCLSLARWADVVVLQKPRLAPKLLAAMAGFNPRLVVDFDDAVWASRGSAPRGRFGDRLAAAVRRAKIVVSGSEYLAAWARRTAPGAEVEVVPSSVDLDQFAGSQHRPGGAGGLALGWIGGPNNLADFTPEVLEALRSAQSGIGSRLMVISSRALDVPDLACELVPWSLEAEAEAISRIDVGLMPLEDTERSRGRCSFKAVQYMAAGKPVVASPVGSASEVVVDGVTGLLATSTADWVEALTALGADPALRGRMGAAGRSRVAARYSVTANLRRWCELLERASGT